MKGMGPLQTGVNNCQKALDYIKANPGHHTMQIAEALGWSQNSAAKRLMRMADRGEIQKTPFEHVLVRSDGRMTQQRTFCYVALVDFTHTAEQILALAKDQPASPPKVKKKPDPKWLTKNKRFDDPFAKPYPNQGGQGAVRRDVTVQSSVEMI
jgi:hypothetical protein